MTSVQHRVPVQIGTLTSPVDFNSNYLILLNWTALLEDDMMEDSSDYVKPYVQTGESGIPTHQRAWMEVRKGAPKVGLELQTNVPVSTQLGPGEVLVKIRAAALNPGYVCAYNLLSNNSNQSNQIFVVHINSWNCFLILLPNDRE